MKSAFLEEARWPPAAEAERIRIGRERWEEARAAQSAEVVAGFMASLAEDERGAALLESVFANSPHLTDLVLARPATLGRLVADGPAAALDAVLAEASVQAAPAAGIDTVMAVLRRAKQDAALIVALADIGGIWPVDTVTAALSRTAETTLGAATRHLLADAAARGKLALPDTADPERGSGLIVLAMGKLGAGELNYSSDIDLVVFYDDGRAPLPADEMGRVFVRLTRDLVRIMEERTRDGYVFRTDLRLRPDPGATPLAVSVTAAETYYGSLAQTWERAAMIRARPVAGDAEAGREFLAMMRPFVWRSALDFAAVEDIRAIKRRIHAHRGHGARAVEGHNIKLGRGGIREIEFFVQTQQMLYGGRNPRLRGRRTVDSLRALAEAGWIDRETAEALGEAYGFLRTLEHRLQMVDDRQTHELPASTDGIEAIARFMGHTGTAEFRAALEARLEAVETAYDSLFAGVGAPEEEAPPLVFTGTDDDPETRAELERLGFANIDGVIGAVRGWLAGRYRATRSERARRIVTDILPTLVVALARTPNPDTALFRFDDFLARLPAGIQLFSLFQAHPSLLDLVAEMLGTSARLAEQLARHTGRLDAVLEPGFFDRLPDRTALEPELAELMANARDFEDVLTVLRRWTNDQRFRAGVHVLRGITPGDACGPFLSDVAEVSLRQLLPRVEAEFAQRHGRFPDGGTVLIGMGKLGGREMSIRSDLDLILLYGSGRNGAEESDGEKPLSRTVYHTRLAQRLISAVTAQMAEGALYEVDMRLRPSGNAGPLATGLEAFAKYQAEDAWTWEHMALTRARVLTGPVELRGRVERLIRETLTRPRDPEALRADVAAMHAKVKGHHGSADPWDVKYAPGGLVDVEFAAQYLQLRHAAERPEVLSPHTATALWRLGEGGCLDPAAAEALIDAHRLGQRLQAFLRLTHEQGFDAQAAVPAVIEGLARAAFPSEEPHTDLLALHERVVAVFGRAADAFAELVGGDADGDGA
ncbi:MAG: bifunctional [glutamine synthetase] adenylyltransferase/[glutamine synthetase]-adenylyl-L-tyrosine phosphorylase [Azospirillaceae bacterium]